LKLKFSIRDATDRPNFGFFPADNLGWGDLSVYGGQVPTPRIDELARGGIRLNNYTVETQCTPTRSAILSGRYSVRSGTYKVPFPDECAMGFVLARWKSAISKLL
jgi:arylsulfatase A-like enzyme